MKNASTGRGPVKRCREGGKHIEMKMFTVKRMLPVELALVLFLSFVGCAKQTPQHHGQTPSISPTAAQTEAPEEYPYKHVPNIINDNYRNYYEIFVGSFYDSDGNGTGDLNGVAQKLDYLNDGDNATNADLGFNGIWLMPVMPSPSYHKYDVTDYYGIDPKYGTIKDFQKLVYVCHERGIKLIIDFVFNHTSAQHPWFLQAVSYFESLGSGEQPDFEVCPYAAYYHFSTEKAGATGWYRAGESDWYYEGVFWDQMPDLALENEAVRREIEKAASFWLELGVDGFRLDAVKEYFSGRPEANSEVLRWFNDYVLSVKPDAYLVGEAWETTLSGVAPYYKSGILSFFNFPLAQATGSVAAVIKRGEGASLAALLTQSAKVYGEVNSSFIDAPFLSNHDTSRISAQYINDARKMKLAAGLLFTMNGSVFVYYGEELGMNSKGDKDENKRLPMHWSDTDFIGTPNPPVGADEVTQKFAALDEQQKDPLSIYSYYKRALQIRNENPEIARGDSAQVPALTSGGICAVSKTYQNSTVLLVYNIGAEAAEVSLTGTQYQGYTLCGYLTVDEATVVQDAGKLCMPSYAIAVLKP